MSWLSKWIDKRTGANKAIDVDAQQTRYNNAMSGVNQGYNKMMGIAEQQMDMDSDMNRNRLAMMEASSADNAAESARLAARAGAQAGGVPAAAMMAQTADIANKAQGNVQGQFLNYMSGQTENALGTMGGVLANQGQIAQAGFNMGESARRYNKDLEKAVAQRKAGMLGGALKLGGGLLMGNPAMALGGAGQMFAQKGGYVKKYNHGGHVGGGLLYQAQLGKKPDPENPKPVGNGESDDDTKASMFKMALSGLAGSAYGMSKSKYSPLPGDTVDAKLEPGEYVLNRNAVNAIGKDKLDKINNEVEPRFDDDKVKMRMGGYLYG